MQHKFVLKLCSAARDMGIHTALDTNGHLGDRLTDADLETIDLVLLDIKSWDEDRHRRLTGCDIQDVLAFARRLAARKRPVWLRFVLVPGLTDYPDDVEHLASFAGALGNIQRVDVLPFHQMGEHKWQRLRLEYKLHDVQPPVREAIDTVCAQFRAAGLSAG
jgi:pyruvate formate lyase activating enzyme